MDILYLHTLRPQTTCGDSRVTRKLVHLTPKMVHLTPKLFQVGVRDKATPIFNGNTIKKSKVNPSPSPPPPSRSLSLTPPNTLNPHPTPLTPNPKPQTRNPKPQPPKPHTLHAGVRVGAGWVCGGRVLVEHHEPERVRGGIHPQPSTLNPKP